MNWWQVAIGAVWVLSLVSAYGFGARNEARRWFQRAEQRLTKDDWVPVWGEDE